jgi:hypothetical protein
MTNMTFDEDAKSKLKALFKDRLKAITFTNPKTGDEEVAIIDKEIWDITIKKYLKKGFIPKVVYDKNSELIFRWELVTENLADAKPEMKDLWEAIKDYSNTLSKIKTDPFYGRIYANSKDIYIERKDRSTTELRNLEEQVAGWKQELVSLDAQVAQLRDFDFLRANNYV